MNNETDLKTLSRVILSLIFILFLDVAHTQSVSTLNIISNDSISSSHEVFFANYGPRPDTSYVADIRFGLNPMGELVSHCDDLTPVDDYTVLVYPDSCEVIDYTLAAQQKGANGIVICTEFNRDLRHTNYLFTPVEIGIPVYSINRVVCDSLYLVYENNIIDSRFDKTCITPFYGEHVIWGNETGQGDFDQGLNEWVVECESDSCWQWIPDGLVTGTFTNHTMQSSTVCNGAVTFNVDGLNPQDPWGGWMSECLIPCKGAIISPNIDLSDKEINGNLALRFDQSYRQFNSCYFVALSTDDGLTWPDTLEINLTAEINALPVDAETTISLEDYTDTDQIKVQFYHIGDYYFWMIDDVRLVDIDLRPDCGISTQDFIAPLMWKTPTTQEIEFPLGAEIYNRGLTLATNVTLKYMLYDEDDSLVWQTEEIFDSLRPDEFISPDSMDMQITTHLEPSTYTGIYRVECDDDIDLNNNEWFTSFKVTDNVYAYTEMPEFSGSKRNFPDSLEVEQYDINSYYLGSVIRSTTEGHYIEKVKIKLGASDIRFSGFLDIIIYEMKEDVHPDSILYLSNLTELGRRSIVVDTMVNQDFVELDFVNHWQNSDFLILRRDKNYLATISTYPVGEDPILLSIFDYDTDFKYRQLLNQNWVHGPAKSRLQSENTLRPIGSYVAPKYSISAADTDYMPIDNILPHIEVYISELPVSTDDIIDLPTFTIFPNPIRDQLNLNLQDFINQKLSIEVRDITGRSILSKALDNVSSSTYNINLKGLMPGIYWINLETEEGILTQKFVK